MRLETFFKNFELLADAPNSVQKLRELILQLAVQGKLVPQDPTDEPASVLQGKIKAEKERLIKEKKIRRSKPLPPIEINEIPFKLSKHWEWIRLGEVGDWGAGATPDRKNVEYYGGSITWFKSGELNDGYIKDSEEKITELALQKCSLRLNKPEDVLIAMYGATIGKVAILAAIATTNQAVCACTCFQGLYNHYLFILLKAYKNYFLNQGAGGAQPNISREKIIHTIAPLPPLKEQERIVTKVDQLMSLCDELETRQRHKRESCVLLNNAAIAQLLTTREPNDFSKHWQSICNNFDLLYSVPENIGKLRQAILQLAVQGKLVPQDPNDEPASVLLEKIKAEKERLIDEGKIRKTEPLPPIELDKIPFELPEGWEWVRLDFICNQVTDGTHHTPTYTATGVPFLSVKDISSGKIDLTNTRYISQEEHKQLIKRCNPEFEDVLLTKVGTTGIAKVIDVNAEFSVFVSLALLKFSKHFLSPYYIELVINSPLVKEQSKKNTQGIGNKNLVLKYIKNFTLPMAPSVEQKRIVAKVEQLMVFCNELEAKLTQSQTDSEKLMDAAVRQVLGV